MNFKKLKLWKLLAVGGVVGLVATVPIITTACSSTTPENKIINETIKWSNGSGFAINGDSVTKNLTAKNSTKSEGVLQVSAKGLAIDAGWVNEGITLSNVDFDLDKQILGKDQLNSDAISNSIGIQNVTFNSLKLESLSKDGTFDISNENYNGKFKLTLNAIPNDGYTWKDNSNKEKDITINNLVINVDGIKFDINKLYVSDSDKTFNNKTLPDKKDNITGETTTEFLEMLKDLNKLDSLKQEINKKIKDTPASFQGVDVVVESDHQEIKKENTNKLIIKFIAKSGFYTSNKELEQQLNTYTPLILKNVTPQAQTPPASGVQNI